MKLSSLLSVLALAVIAALASFPALADVDGAAGDVCISASDKLIGVGAVVVTIFSFLANIVPDTNPLGKAVHWLALNFRVNKK